MSYLLNFKVAAAISLSSTFAYPLFEDTESQPEEKGTFQLVVEVCRHGERAPMQLDKIAKDPADDFKIPGRLTMTGAQHHYALGQNLRKYYIDEHKLLSDAYNSDEVYTQTTSIQRTIDSANSQLDGLFDLPLKWPEPEDSFQLNTVPSEDDWMLHAHSHCQRWEDMSADDQANESTKKMMYEIGYDMEESGFYPELRKKAG